MLTRKKANAFPVIACAFLESRVKFWSSRLGLTLKQRNLQNTTLLLSLFFFKGVLANLQKATVIFFMSVRPSDRRHGTTRLALDEFCEIWRIMMGTLRYKKINVHIWWYLVHLSLEWEVFQRNVVEKIKTNIMLNNFFFSRKSYRLWDNVQKCCRAGQTTDDNGVCVLHTGYLTLQTHTQNM